MRTLVIAEAGSCHDGDFVKMVALARAASEGGADVLKIQFWSDPDRLANRRKVPDHYRDLYRRYRVPKEWLRPLKETCHGLGLKLGMTTYLPEDVPTVARFADVFKIASFEAECEDLLTAHEPFRDRPLVVSMGMGAHRMRYLQGAAPTYYLRCVSAYPAPAEALNLALLWPCHDASGLDGCDPFDGLSDHTLPELTWTGALAVAAGAIVIEAHLRLDNTAQDNPDAPHAMVPQQFHAYTRHIRFAETCVGTANARRQDCEQDMAQYRAKP